MERISILFYHYKSKVNSKGLAPIYLRITINKKSSKYSTGIKIAIKDWDKAKTKIRGRSPEVNRFNNQLDSLKAQILDIVYDLEKGKIQVTPEKIITVLKGENTEEATLLSTFDRFIEGIQELEGRGYQQSTINKFIYIREHLRSFMQREMRVEDLVLSELKRGFLASYEQHFLQRVEQITVNKEIQRIKQVMNYAEEHELIKTNPFRNYRMKHVKKDIVFLTEEELKRLEEKVFHVERLEYVRDFFLFSCYTGLGYAEAEALGTFDITGMKDGFQWIEVFRKKTQLSYNIPLLPKAEELLRKYEGHPLCEIKGTLLPTYSNQKVNSYLKEIAVLCEITKKLTHHVARKTFASTVLILNDVPMDIVSKALGHSSVSITQKHYAKVRDIGMAKHFQNLKNKVNEPTVEYLKKAS
ncbi:site-specific integrase [Reichenbachiella agariperforans]|uniref:site-specific integrase n=1 Tax=Reichenbachiella agariperforans TaxID=156994 RepID=UPI001C09DA5A|nr:site-specific integrase [Reichenbachiella agariperforans]MBU2915952.1 site-specific integrase [Reichenbachiella agariperforans]